MSFSKSLLMVQSLVTWSCVGAVTVHAICGEDYCDAWLLLCAILVMDSVRNFFQFIQGRGIIKLRPSLSTLAQTVIWLVGSVSIWAVAKATLPKSITGDFRIMAPVLMAFVTISLINWICQLKPAKRVKSAL